VFFCKRGYGKNRGRTVNPSSIKYRPVNLLAVENAFESGDIVAPLSLVEKGVVSREKGKLPNIKILGMGEITKKVTISGCAVSETAKAKIEKIGGAIK